MTTNSKKDLFGSVKLDELSQPLRGARPGVMIPFSSKLRFSTLVRLKQAMHHLGGVEQEFIDAAVLAALELLPEANQPLPAPKQLALEQLLRKVQG